MRLLASLLVAVTLSGCASLGESRSQGLTVLQDLAPFEVLVRLQNPADHAIVVEPSSFRIEGADGTVFPGTASGRPEALGSTNVGAGRGVEGWVSFHVGAYAVRPLTLIYEAEGVKLETTLAEA